LTQIQQSLKILKSDLQDINQATTNAANKKGHLNSLVISTKEVIAKIDTDDLIKEGEDSVDNPYFFFSPLQEKELCVVSAYQIESVSCTLGDRRCKWSTDIKYHDKGKRVTRQIESFFCGGIAGTLIAFVVSKVKNATRLQMTNRELLEHSLELAKVEEELKKYEANSLKKDSQIEQFAKRAQQAGAVSGKLYSDTMTLTEYMTTRPIFSMGEECPVDVLVQKYCKFMNLEAEFLVVQ